MSNLPSLADYDFNRLSPRSQETIENIWKPLADGDRRGDVAAIAEELEMTPREVRQAMDELRTEMEAQRLGARLPQLSHDEFEALKESIHEYGQLVPVVKSKQGSVIDGRHRLRACEELGVRPWVVESDVGGFDGDLREHELAANVVRRHLTATQRRVAIEAEVIHDHQRSDRSIALLFGVSPTTVGKARSDLEARGKVSRMDTRVGADGVVQPVSPPRQVMAREVERDGDAKVIHFKVAVEFVDELLAGIGPVRLQLEEIGGEYQLVVTRLDLHAA